MHERPGGGWARSHSHATNRWRQKAEPGFAARCKREPFMKGERQARWCRHSLPICSRSSSHRQFVEDPSRIDAIHWAHARSPVSVSQGDQGFPRGCPQPSWSSSANRRLVIVSTSAQMCDGASTIVHIYYLAPIPILLARHASLLTTLASGPICSNSFQCKRKAATVHSAVAGPVRQGKHTWGPWFLTPDRRYWLRWLAQPDPGWVSAWIASENRAWAIVNRSDIAGNALMVAWGARSGWRYAHHYFIASRSGIPIWKGRQATAKNAYA